MCASNPPLVEPFTGTSEVKIDLSDDPKASEFFKFFFPDEIIQDWVDQTNMYVLSKLDEKWIIRSKIIKISRIGKSNHFFCSFSYHSIFACPIPIILMGNT